MNDISEVPLEPGIYIGAEDSVWRFDGKIWHNEGAHFQPFVMSNEDGPFVRVYTADEVIGAAYSAAVDDLASTATIDPVPNQPKTPVSTFRIPQELKAAVKAKTQERGDDMTEIVVKAFEAYLKKK